MSLFRGIAQVALGDQAISEYPAGFQALGQDYLIKWPPLHYSFSLFLILAFVFALTLHRTALGRKLYAIGANPVAARFSGIPVERIKFGLFVLTGVLSGIAAVLLTARVGSTRPNIALGWELEVVTMVILGGVSIAGGSGTIPGVVIAVFVLGLVTFGLSLDQRAGHRDQRHPRLPADRLDHASDPGSKTHVRAGLESFGCAMSELECLSARPKFRRWSQRFRSVSPASEEAGEKIASG